MPQIFLKIKDFWLQNEQKIVLVLGFCLVSAVSFEFGFLQGQKWQQKPLVIEKPAELANGQLAQAAANSEPTGASQTSSGQVSSQTAVAGKNACAFVGSRNSNKFYLPTCSYAKRIKPENVVCFKSAEEALAQGRTESKCATSTK